MLMRLGNVLYWLCCGLAAVPWLLTTVALYAEGKSANATAAAMLIAAAAMSIGIWLIGRATRYVLSGT